MPDYLGYNPYQDAAGAFAGASDTLGSTILRSAMLKQNQAQRQQDLMMELMKMRQQQEQFGAQQKVSEDTLGLKRQEFDVSKAYTGAQTEKLQRENRVYQQALQALVPKPKFEAGPDASVFEQSFARRQQPETPMMSPVIARQLLGLRAPMLHNTSPGQVALNEEGSPIYTNTEPQFSTRQMDPTSQYLRALQGLKLIADVPELRDSPAGTNAVRLGQQLLGVQEQPQQQGVTRMYSPSQKKFYLKNANGQVIEDPNQAP